MLMDVWEKFLVYRADFAIS